MFEHFKKFTMMEETNSVATDSTGNNALLADSLPLSVGDKIEVYAEHGEDEKWWKPATFYGKAVHEKRTWKDCYIIAYYDNGSLDEVTTIRKR